LEFRKHTLDNGLQIIAECNPRACATAMAFFVNTGSRDENDALSGVSHFLEHMAFKGTSRRSAADVNRELDEIGSRANAYTSEENTVYHAVVLPEHQDHLLDLLADMMRPALREDDFNMEKKVILEEIAKYNDEPPYRAPERCMSAWFADHPLGRSVLGSTESVSALTPSAMREYFEARYRPNNIVLAAAGRVDFERLVSEADRLCHEWEPRETLRSRPPANGNTTFQTLLQENATQQYAFQISAAPAAEDDDRYAANILAAVLGDDSGSRLFWELADPGLADFAVMASEDRSRRTSRGSMPSMPRWSATTSASASCNSPRARSLRIWCGRASAARADCSPSAHTGFSGDDTLRSRR
jgi:predicted Zn-dependent peptidase